MDYHYFRGKVQSQFFQPAMIIINNINHIITIYINHIYIYIIFNHIYHVKPYILTIYQQYSSTGAAVAIGCPAPA